MYTFTVTISVKTPKGKNYSEGIKRENNMLPK